MTNHGLLSLEAVAARYGVTRRTVLAWCRQRKISHLRVGRRVVFRPSDVAEYEDAGRRPARAVHGQARLTLAAIRAEAARRGRSPR